MKDIVNKFLTAQRSRVLLAQSFTQAATIIGDQIGRRSSSDIKEIENLLHSPSCGCLTFLTKEEVDSKRAELAAHEF